MMHISVDTSSPVPAYEQLRAQISALVASGSLATGARLPAIRQLAGDLGLAPNTVGRAYRELEREGVIQGRGRMGTVVIGRASMGRRERRKMVDKAAQVYVREARQHGADLAELLTAVRRAHSRLAAEHGPATPEETQP